MIFQTHEFMNFQIQNHVDTGRAYDLIVTLMKFKLQLRDRVWPCSAIACLYYGCLRHSNDNDKVQMLYDSGLKHIRYCQPLISAMDLCNKCSFSFVSGPCIPGPWIRCNGYGLTMNQFQPALHLPAFYGGYEANNKG